MSVAHDTACTGKAPVDSRPLVLIAEDEELIAEVVGLVAEDAGYRPVVALHGQQALAMARDRWPALLITDLMMPHLDGAELIAALHAEAAATGRVVPPAILMTAASLPYARAAGADAILRKPFALQDLITLLHRFLDDPSGDKGAVD
jgi:two-component system chemotaxis response regulator CheY